MEEGHLEKNIPNTEAMYGEIKAKRDGSSIRPPLTYLVVDKADGEGGGEQS